MRCRFGEYTAFLAVYACTCLDEVGKIPWVMLHYRRRKWVRNITR